MNPEPTGREEMEARITALLLGELATAQADEVRAAIECDPELARLRDRLRQTIELVREASTKEPGAALPSQVGTRLSESRRTELLTRFRVVALKQPARERRSWSWAIPMAAAAGLTLVLSVLNLHVETWGRFELSSIRQGEAYPAYDATIEKLSETAVPGESVFSRYASRPDEAGKPVEELGQLAQTPAEPEQLRRQWRRSAVPAATPAAETPARTAGRAVESDGGKLFAGAPVSTTWGDFDNNGQMDHLVSQRSPEVGQTLIAEDDTARGFRAANGKSFYANGGSIGGVGGGGPTGPVATGGEELFAKIEDTSAPAGSDQYFTFSRSNRADEPQLFDALGTLAMKPESAQESGAKDIAFRGKNALPESASLGLPVLGDVPTLGRGLSDRAGLAPMTGARMDRDLRKLKEQEVVEGKLAAGVPVERYEEAVKLGELSGYSIAAGTGRQAGSHVSIPPVNLTQAASTGYSGGEAGVTASYEAAGQTGRLDPEVRRRILPSPEPQPEVLTAEQPFSTFSLNVSDVSFKLAAASLANGVLPEPATIRSEEFINAFDYRDPEPAAGDAIALAWERGRYPFAHDRDLLRFSVRTAAQGRALDRPLNLVLLLDSSGSMERADRVGIIREAMRVLADQIQPQDRVSVVSFARTPRLWVDGLPGTAAGELPDRVGELTPEGGTNLEAALELAYETAARHFVADGLNRLVLLTDGAANLGAVEPQSLQSQVEANRLRGIALDCFGIGWEGYNDDLLEVLSRHGDGRYGFVNTPGEAASGFADQLAGALQIAAANVKVQVEFNPARVTAYRQVGYAKHQLAEEQFRDNTVDAAEIGAAESGNALYVAQVEPQGQGPIGVVRARYQDPATGDYHEQEWALPYVGPAPPLEAAGVSLRLAGAAAAFAEWLVRSPFAGEVTPDRLLRVLEGVPEAFEPDPRPQQLRQMIFQGNALAGR